MRFGLSIMACLGLFVAAANAQLTGYEDLVDLSRLPMARSGRSISLASSYDRSGANDDYNNYQSPAGFQDSAVANTLVGEWTSPGSIPPAAIPPPCVRPPGRAASRPGRASRCTRPRPAVPSAA
jgi:hypothetical protein